MSGVLAIIPARGGSKGIPRKNLRPFLGKPLLAHSIEHALAAPAVSAHRSFDRRPRNRRGGARVRR